MHSLSSFKIYSSAVRSGYFCSTYGERNCYKGLILMLPVTWQNVVEATLQVDFPFLFAYCFCYSTRAV